MSEKNCSKWIKSILVSVMCLFCLACDKEEPVILFNSQPITTQTIAFHSKSFDCGKNINYVLLNPKGFNSPYLRLQVLKKEKKVQNWGYKMYYSKNIKVDETKNFYLDSLTINQPGLYIMSLYYLDNLSKAIARSDFVVN